MRKDGLMSFRLPKAMKATIKVQAEAERRTIQNQVLVIMELGLRELAKTGTEKGERVPQEQRA